MKQNQTELLSMFPAAENGSWRRSWPKKPTVDQPRDIGNEFYRLWLDREMVYTCAYFAELIMSPEGAQIAKLDPVCPNLHLALATPRCTGEGII